MVDTWLTEFRIDRICVVSYVCFICMFKQVRSGWTKAIRLIRNSVNTGPTKNIAWVVLALFFKWAIPGLFFAYFRLFKQTLQF